MDILVAGGALLFFAPLLALVAILIKLESPGPVLFRQSRGGLNGQAFTIFKFRSMRCQENGSKVVQAKRDDDRITTLGKIIRKTSIDELPQLLNVLKGDMSRNRTGVHGFAIRCVTTPPPGHPGVDAVRRRGRAFDTGANAGSQLANRLCRTATIRSAADGGRYLARPFSAMVHRGMRIRCPLYSSPAEPAI